MDNVRTLPPETADDLNPQNLHLISQEMRDPRSQGANQQAILQQEKARLEQAQAQQAGQQFQQRLEQRLNPRIGTEEDTDKKALFMFRLMEMMKRRHRGPTP